MPNIKLEQRDPGGKYEHGTFYAGLKIPFYQLGSFYSIRIFLPHIHPSFSGSRDHLMYVYFQKPRSTLFSANGISQIETMSVYDMV